ncbi:RNase H domain-containing protein [Trichonephila clavipes]|nr:RNase H domain-containing protein [Trichonephila clavipes]
MDPSLLCQGRGLVLPKLTIDETANSILNKLHNIHPSTSHWAALPVRRHDVHLTRLRIGHTRFTHRHLLLGENAPECPSYKVPYSVYHILIDCPVFNNYRITFFNSSHLTLPDLVIAKFCSCAIKPNTHSLSHSKPTIPSKIPTVMKSSTSTEVQLLPSASSVAATSSESQPPVPFVITTSSASISLSTSTKTMFTALSNRAHHSDLETTTSNSIPSNITSPVSQASKQ